MTRNTQWSPCSTTGPPHGGRQRSKAGQPPRSVRGVYSPPAGIAGRESRTNSNASLSVRFVIEECRGGGSRRRTAVHSSAFSLRFVFPPRQGGSFATDSQRWLGGRFRGPTGAASPSASRVGGMSSVQPPRRGYGEQSHCWIDRKPQPLRDACRAQSFEASGFVIGRDRSGNSLKRSSRDRGYRRTFPD